MQNFVVIGGAYFKLEHTKFLFNFEFDRNTFSGTRPGLSVLTYVTVKCKSQHNPTKNM